MVSTFLFLLADERPFVLLTIAYYSYVHIELRLGRLTWPGFSRILTQRFTTRHNTSNPRLADINYLHHGCRHRLLRHSSTSATRLIQTVSHRRQRPDPFASCAGTTSLRRIGTGYHAATLRSQKSTPIDPFPAPRRQT